MAGGAGRLPFNGSRDAAAPTRQGANGSSCPNPAQVKLTTPLLSCWLCMRLVVCCTILLQVWMDVWQSAKLQRPPLQHQRRQRLLLAAAAQVQPQQRGMRAGVMIRTRRCVLRCCWVWLGGKKAAPSHNAYACWGLNDYAHLTPCKKGDAPCCILVVGMRVH